MTHSSNEKREKSGKKVIWTLVVLIFLLLAGMVIYFINMNLKQEEEMKQINAEKEAMQKKIDKASKEAQEANEQAKEKERLLAEEQARLEAERKAEEEERKKAEKEQEEKNKKDPAYKAGLCPDANHPHAIDLGIGVKWVCCNVGASAPWEYGDYYAWGETTTKNVYDDETYKYYDEINEEYINIGNEIAGTKYDVAHVKWGGKWKMPNQR